VEKACKTASPVRHGWPMMHQDQPAVPDGWPFCRLPLGSFHHTAEYPTANTEYPMFKERECRPAFTRVESAKKKMSRSTSHGGQWIFLVGYWKFLVGCWILKKWFLSNDGAGAWNAACKTASPVRHGWLTTRQDQPAVPDGWPLCIRQRKRTPSPVMRHEPFFVPFFFSNGRGCAKLGVTPPVRYFLRQRCGRFCASGASRRCDLLLCCCFVLSSCGHLNQAARLASAPLLGGGGEKWAGE